MFYRNPDHNGMKLRRSETFHGRLAVSLRSSGAKDIVDVRVYKHLAALRPVPKSLMNHVNTELPYYPFLYRRP